MRTAHEIFSKWNCTWIAQNWIEIEYENFCRHLVIIAKVIITATWRWRNNIVIINACDRQALNRKCSFIIEKGFRHHHHVGHYCVHIKSVYPHDYILDVFIHVERESESESVCACILYCVVFIVMCAYLFNEKNSSYWNRWMINEEKFSKSIRCRHHAPSTLTNYYHIYKMYVLYMWLCHV